VFPFLSAVWRAHGVAGPEQLEDVGFLDELRQTGLPALTGTEGEHVLEVLVPERADDLGEARYDRLIVVGVGRENLAIPLRRLGHRWCWRPGCARCDADRQRHFAEEQRTAPDTDGPAHDRPDEVGACEQPEHDLVHRLPPVEFGLARVTPEGGQVHRDS
jgi:hypothetical protein